jgi:hypothetical protein
MMPSATDQKVRSREVHGSVYCPLCTHTVPATVLYTARAAKVMPGQKCPRCHSSLDAGYVLRVRQAA